MGFLSEVGSGGPDGSGLRGRSDVINTRHSWRSGGICMTMGMSLATGALAQSFPAFTVQTIPNPDGATFVSIGQPATLADNGDAAVDYFRSGLNWTHGYRIHDGTATALTPVSDSSNSTHPLGKSARVLGITPGGIVFGRSGPCAGTNGFNGASVYWTSPSTPVSIIDPTLPANTDRRVGCGVQAMNDRLQGALSALASGSTRTFVGSHTNTSGALQVTCSPLGGLTPIGATRMNRSGTMSGGGSCNGGSAGVGVVWTFEGTLKFRELNVSISDLDDAGRFVGNDPTTTGADIWTGGVRTTLTNSNLFSPRRMNNRGDVVGSQDQIILNGTLFSYTQATGLLPPGYVRVAFLDINDRGQVLVAFIQAPGNVTDPSIAAILTPAPAPNVVRNPGFDGSLGGWRPWSPRFPASGPPLAGYFPMPFGPVGNTGAKIDSGEGAAISQYVDIAQTPSRVRLTMYAATPGGTVSVAIGSTVIGSVDTAMLPANAASVLTIPIPAGLLGQNGVVLDVSYAGADGLSVLVDDITIETYCPGDFNADTFVDDADFVVFAEAYNLLDCGDPVMPAGCPADLNADGFVDDADFVLFAAAYNELLCP